MLALSPFFAGFAVNDMAKAKSFYADTLGVRVVDVGESLAMLNAGNGYAVLVYEKPNHTPAEHTVLNFPVPDIEAAVDALRAGEWSSSSTIRVPSRPMTRGSRIPVRGRPGSATRPAISCRCSRIEMT